ncbi:ankyrin repeat-containing domain protein [Fusarium oxysporum]|nr:ankyrin repeat-containing domain protein [Fusarium oxysporum]
MSNPQKYTIGWICAIATEYLAAQLFLDEEHEGPEFVSGNDSNHYTLGKIGKHNVVIAVLPHGEYGISSATGVAKDMLNSFPNVRFGLMVGIGGGAPTPEHDIRLGDVVVSASGHGKGGVFQYDFGKAVQGQEFQETGFLNQPPTILRAAVHGLLTQYKRKGHQLDKHIDDILVENPRLKKEFQRPESSTDRLFHSSKVHPPNDQSSCAKACGDDPSTLVMRSDRTEYEDNPAIHYGLIASSNRLMKDALTRDALAAKKGVLCFEMEAAGLMNHFPCLVIRGICDYSDSHKNKEWQGFAAMMAAAYAKDLLRQIPPSKVEAEKPISEILTSIESTGNETKHAVMSLASNHHFAKIERWLSPPDYSTNANLAREHRHPGTGAWLLNSPVFQEWKLGSRQHLWLYGLAGCGKTILSTTILDHLLQIDTHTMLTFFFDFNDPKKQKLEDLLRSLAVQLYHKGNEAARRLDSLFASHDDGRRQPDANALSACVDTMIQTAGKVFIIIDAIDECTAREELLQWLKHLASRKAQLIVTGRPEVEFQSVIPRSFGKRNCVQLDKNVVNGDIRSYVNATLKQKPDFVDKKLSRGILDEIRDTIGNEADGMFRWAACQLENLARCLSPKAIKIALRSLPRDLNETYYRMLQNIPSEYKSSAIRLLQFLVHTKRPLTLQEAIEVIATEIDQEPRGFDVDGRLSLKTDVLRYCPSMVIITTVTNYTGTVEELHLAHFSVKEYLLKQAQFDPKSASLAIAKTCLTYLTDTRDKHGTIRRHFPMARYAAEYWTEYAVSAETSEEIVRTTVSFLRDETTFQRWCRLYQADRPMDYRPGPPRASGLYYVCLCGLARVARALITEGADVNAQGGEYEYALHAASYGGHQEVVQLLLDEGADVNAQGGKYGNALQAASIGCGDLEVVRLLLGAGADVNAQGGKYGNALQAASLRGSREVVRLLLDAGADANWQGDEYEYALCAASLNGHLEVMQLLLDAGADVNMQGGLLDYALYNASQGGKREVVRLLLDAGADVNAQGDEYGNALQAASDEGDQEVVRLLLDAGADVNAQGGEYGNALQSASYRGRQEVVQLLLDAGANVNAQGGQYSNALQAASNEGHLEVIQLLLDAGADVNAQGGKYGNALHATSRRGNQEVVRLLLDAGADVNAQGGKYEYALHAASYKGPQEVVRLLLDAGADVNAQGGPFGHILQTALFNSDLEVMQLLLDKGADVNAQGGPFGNVLQAASFGYGDLEVVRLLLGAGADVNAQGGEYGNALHAASYRGNQEVAQLLLDAGADVNAQGSPFGNALQAAPSEDNQDVV